METGSLLTTGTQRSLTFSKNSLEQNIKPCMKCDQIYKRHLVLNAYGWGS